MCLALWSFEDEDRKSDTHRATIEAEHSEVALATKWKLRVGLGTSNDLSLVTGLSNIVPPSAHER